MSGVDAQYLAGIVFGLFMIALGVLQLLGPVMAQREAERAHEQRLRHGESTDLRRLPPSERWVGFVFIFAGATYLILPYSGAGQPVLQIVMGAMLFVAGVGSLLFGARFEAWRLRRHQGDWPANTTSGWSGRRRLYASLILILFGGAFLALGLIMPR